MSLQVVAGVDAGSVIDAADAEALSELYNELPGGKPDWCDLTPELDTTPRGDDNLGGVRL